MAERQRNREAEVRRESDKEHTRPGAPGYTPESDTGQPVDLDAEQYGLQPRALSTHDEPAEGPIGDTEN